MRPSSILSLILFAASSAYGLRLPLQARAVPFSPRATTAASSVPVSNFENDVYIVNMTLGGMEVAIQIDTGSSDLWAIGQIPNTQDTGKTGSVSYAVGQASGPILTTPLTFAGFNVTSQAFINVQNASAAGDPQAEGFVGLVGLGPGSGSVIEKAIAGAVPMMDNIFRLNMTTQNYITLLLSRDSDPESVVGQMTISEPVPSYDSVTSQTKLSLVDVDKLENVLGLQHWSTYVDANGVIGPDGNAISVSSLSPSTPKNQLVTVFDSGFTLPQVSRGISDAIYGRVHGAVYNTSNEFWTIPCAQELNVTFVFGGQKFPVHPLDLSITAASVEVDLPLVNGTAYCIGAFQPINGGAIDTLGGYDLILGMGFLRNAYILLDFGDFVSETSIDRGDPYIQMLALTSPSQAHTDFVNTRLNGTDTTGLPQYALLPASQQQHSPLAPGEAKALFIAKDWRWIVLGVLVAVGLLLGCCCWCCCCRRRKTRGGGVANSNYVFAMPAAAQRFVPTSWNRGDTARAQRQSPPSGAYQNPYNPSYQSYQGLNHPAPEAAEETHEMGGYK